MDYVSDIATSILSDFEDVTILSPEMYTAIAEWEKREIPVAVVLSSIKEVAGRQNGSRREPDLPVDLIQSLVIRNFREWLARG